MPRGLYRIKKVAKTKMSVFHSFNQLRALFREAFSKGFYATTIFRTRWTLYVLIFSIIIINTIHRTQQYQEQKAFMTLFGNCTQENDTNETCVPPYAGILVEFYSSSNVHRKITLADKYPLVFFDGIPCDIFFVNQTYLYVQNVLIPLDNVYIGGGADLIRLKSNLRAIFKYDDFIDMTVTWVLFAMYIVVTFTSTVIIATTALIWIGIIFMTIFCLIVFIIYVLIHLLTPRDIFPPNFTWRY